MGNTFQKMFSSDPYPVGDVPHFDPHFGFSGERKKRVMPVPEEVLIAAKVPKRKRDYCSHLYLEYQYCYMKEYPFVQRCVEETHKYHKCQFDDHVLRMKEYERERRLLLREQAKKNAEKAIAA